MLRERGWKWWREYWEMRIESLLQSKGLDNVRDDECCFIELYSKVEDNPGQEESPHGCIQARRPVRSSIHACTAYR